jgi:hypothetical protein
MSDLLEPVLRDTFEQRAGQLDPAARVRVLAVDYRPRQRRILPALGAAGLAGAAAAIALVFTLGSTPTPASAFAGWSPVPTPARPGETAAAIAQCGLGRPALIDTRGPFTAAVYANPKPRAVPGMPSQQSSPPQPPVKYSVGSCFVGRGTMASAASQSTGDRVHPGQIQVTEHTVSGGSEDATVLDGRVGHGVTAVRIDLSNNRRVTATVAHGWYLAWWPGRAHGTAVEITAGGRSRTSRLPASAEVGAGSCSGCASSGPVMNVGR